MCRSTLSQSAIRGLAIVSYTDCTLPLPLSEADKLHLHFTAARPCNVVAVTLATSESKIQRIGLDDTLAKGLVSSLGFSCPIRCGP